MTDSEGKECWHGQPDSWGKVKWETHEREIKTGGPQNLRMQGQYLDRETGLHYNLHRYYDPDSGRFTQHDPIGLAGGLNLYQYAPNALGWVDPWGLSCGSPKEARNKNRKGQGPKEVTRIDPPDPDNVPGSQWHAHGKNGGAINTDGTIHDDDPKFSKVTLKWLKEHGWNMDDWL